jgi:glycerophosphoryl diester phosphodiesterase
LLIAHRGASMHAPENTLSAFELARDMGAKYIECDISFSKDKIPFIFHDDFLNRTTNSEGAVNSKTWQQIKNLDAGLWFAKEFEGEKILSLIDLIEWHKNNNNICLNLEIKSISLEFIPEYVQIILNSIGSNQNILLSSFQNPILQYLNDISCAFPRALLVKRWSIQSIYDAKSFSCEQINVGNIYLTKRMVEKTHDENLKIGVYTVNSTRRFKALKQLGVDAIFTDNCMIDLKKP